jgi:hypothetical protein
VLLLEGGTLKEAQIFSQESRIRIEALERKEGAQALGSQRVFLFSEWPTTQGGMWGSIYSPHLKRALEDSFTRQVRWTSSFCSYYFYIIYVQLRMFLLLPVTSMGVVSRRSRPMRAGFPTGTRRHRSSDGAHSLLRRRVCALRER